VGKASRRKRIPTAATLPARECDCLCGCANASLDKPGAYIGPLDSWFCADCWNHALDLIQAAVEEERCIGCGNEILYGKGGK
jgi:hypothetical protein